jgi:hypothetical protein
VLLPIRIGRVHRFGPRRIGKEIGPLRSDAGSGWRSSITSRNSGTWKRRAMRRRGINGSKRSRSGLDEELSRP